MEKKKIKVYLAIPSTGDRIDIQTYLFRDLAKLYSNEIEMVFPTGCVHRTFHDFARNEMVDDFLATDCDVLWFLDSDVCPPQYIFDLIKNHWDKWEVAGAPYPIYMPTPGTGEMSILFTVYKGVIQNEDQPGIYMAETPQTGTDWVDALATGCLFIKRDVFSKLEKPYFEFKFDPKTRRIKEGEDLGFALKLHKQGIKFFTDYSMVCKHYKRTCLLDMNNYAISLANYKVMEHDKQIRETIVTAIRSAQQAAYEDGLKDGAARSRKSDSGLLLPQSLIAR